MPQISIGKLCGLFGVSRQAYYNDMRTKEKRCLETQVVLQHVKAVRTIHPRMGCRKIYELIKSDLQEAGIKLGRDKLFELMSDNEMLIRKRRKRVWTTNSYHSFRKYRNLIKEYIPYKANQLWVSDITYIKVEQEYYYLFLITDAYSKKIVGYKLARTLEAKHALESLTRAINKAKNIEGLIHHSDRGIQYCSHKYVKLLQDKGIQISMTEDSDPTDNAIAERVNGILKEEYIEPLRENNYGDTELIVTSAIHRYNAYRPHLSCDMLTPNRAHRKVGILNKRWKNYYNLETEIN